MKLLPTGLVRRAIRWLLTVVLIVGAIAMIFPLFWLVSSSLRPAYELLLLPPRLIPVNWSLDNYVDAFRAAPLFLYLWNSLAFATVSTCFILLTSSTAGYVFAKFQFPGNNFLFMLVLATAIVPFEIYMVPLFLQVNALGLVNTPLGLYLPFLIMSFGIFFMRQNTITSVPDELLNAARIDGLSETGIMLRLVPRLLAPALATLAILAFTQAWAVFVWALVILNEQRFFPMELGLSQFANSFTTDWGVTSAGAVVGILPVAAGFLILRRRIVEGVTLTGLQG